MSKTPRFQVRSEGALQRAEGVQTRPPISTTVRWPDEIHRWLTMKARDERTSIQEMVVGWAKHAMKRDAA
jgi:predicted HicB family RNase H-like nuclease